MLEYKQPIPRTVPDTKLSYSDHEAVTTKILIQPRKKATDAEDSCSAKSAKVNEKSYADTLGEGIEVLDQILKRLRSDKSAYFVSYSSKHKKKSTKILTSSLFSFISGDGFSVDHSVVLFD